MLKLQLARNHIFYRNGKRFLLSASVIFAFFAFTLYQRLTGAVDQKSLDAGLIFPKGQLISQSAHHYKDGTYTGKVFPAGYGQVQVKAIVKNGKIADVEFLDYPHARQTSQRINARAMPWLQREAIRVQGANVNAISGATLTSKAFEDSLQSALQFAQN